MKIDALITPGSLINLHSAALLQIQSSSHVGEGTIIAQAHGGSKRGQQLDHLVPRSCVVDHIVFLIAVHIFPMN